jgi:hypothetical protein
MQQSDNKDNKEVQSLDNKDNNTPQSLDNKDNNTLQSLMKFQGAANKVAPRPASTEELQTEIEAYKQAYKMPRKTYTPSEFLDSDFAHYLPTEKLSEAKIGGFNFWETRGLDPNKQYEGSDLVARLSQDWERPQGVKVTKYRDFISSSILSASNRVALLSQLTQDWERPQGVKLRPKEKYEVSAPLDWDTTPTFENVSTASKIYKALSVRSFLTKNKNVPLTLDEQKNLEWAGRTLTRLDNETSYFGTKAPKELYGFITSIPAAFDRDPYGELAIMGTMIVTEIAMAKFALTAAGLIARSVTRTAGVAAEHLTKKQIQNMAAVYGGTALLGKAIGVPLAGATGAMINKAISEYETEQSYTEAGLEGAIHNSKFVFTVGAASLGTSLAAGAVISKTHKGVQAIGSYIADIKSRRTLAVAERQKATWNGEATKDMHEGGRARFEGTHGAVKEETGFQDEAAVPTVKIEEYNMPNEVVEDQSVIENTTPDIETLEAEKIPGIEAIKTKEYELKDKDEILGKVGVYFSKIKNKLAEIGASDTLNTLMSEYKSTKAKKRFEKNAKKKEEFQQKIDEIKEALKTVIKSVGETAGKDIAQMLNERGFSAKTFKKTVGQEKIRLESAIEKARKKKNKLTKELKAKIAQEKKARKKLEEQLAKQEEKLKRKEITDKQKAKYEKQIEKLKMKAMISSARTEAKIMVKIANLQLKTMELTADQKIEITKKIESIKGKLQEKDITTERVKLKDQIRLENEKIKAATAALKLKENIDLQKTVKQQKVIQTLQKRLEKLEKISKMTKEEKTQESLKLETEKAAMQSKLEEETLIYKEKLQKKLEDMNTLLEDLKEKLETMEDRDEAPKTTEKLRTRIEKLEKRIKTQTENTEKLMAKFRERKEKKQKYLISKAEKNLTTSIENIKTKIEKLEKQIKTKKEKLDKRIQKTELKRQEQKEKIDKSKKELEQKNIDVEEQLDASERELADKRFAKVKDKINELKEQYEEKVKKFKEAFSKKQQKFIEKWNKKLKILGDKIEKYSADAAKKQPNILELAGKAESEVETIANEMLAIESGSEPSTPENALVAQKTDLAIKEITGELQEYSKADFSVEEARKKVEEAKGDIKKLKEQREELKQFESLKDIVDQTVANIHETQKTEFLGQIQKGQRVTSTELKDSGLFQVEHYQGGEATFNENMALKNGKEVSRFLKQAHTKATEGMNKYETLRYYMSLFTTIDANVVAYLNKYFNGYLLKNVQLIAEKNPMVSKIFDYFDPVRKLRKMFRDPKINEALLNYKVHKEPLPDFVPPEMKQIADNLTEMDLRAVADAANNGYAQHYRTGHISQNYNIYEMIKRKDEWISEHLKEGTLDWEKMGKGKLSDTEKRIFIEKTYQAIIEETGGFVDTIVFGKSSPRVLEYQNYQAWEYHQHKYGNKNNVLESELKKNHAMAQKNAVTSVMGGDPIEYMRMLNNEKTDLLQGTNDKRLNVYNAQINSMLSYHFDTVGSEKTGVSNWMHVFNSLNNLGIALQTKNAFLYPLLETPIVGSLEWSRATTGAGVTSSSYWKSFVDFLKPQSIEYQALVKLGTIYNLDTALMPDLFVPQLSNDAFNATKTFKNFTDNMTKTINSLKGADFLTRRNKSIASLQWQNEIGQLLANGTKWEDLSPAIKETIVTKGGKEAEWNKLLEHKNEILTNDSPFAFDVDPSNPTLSDEALDYAGMKNHIFSPINAMRSKTAQLDSSFHNLLQRWLFIEAKHVDRMITESSRTASAGFLGSRLKDHSFLSNPLKDMFRYQGYIFKEYFKQIEGLDFVARGTRTSRVTQALTLKFLAGLVMTQARWAMVGKEAGTGWQLVMESMARGGLIPFVDVLFAEEKYNGKKSFLEYPSIAAKNFGFSGAAHVLETLNNAYDIIDSQFDKDIVKGEQKLVETIRKSVPFFGDFLPTSLIMMRGFLDSLFSLTLPHARQIFARELQKNKKYSNHTYMKSAEPGSWISQKRRSRRRGASTSRRRSAS